jgi:methionine-rich copper-binding protein CopC
MAESTSDDQFRILQREIREAIRRNHPNPERIGCPGTDTLRRMAAAAAPPSDPGYSHVMECSPCYEELMGLSAAAEAGRSEVATRRRRRVLIGVLAAAMIVAGIVVYVFSTRAVSPGHQAAPQVARGASEKQPPQKLAGPEDGLSVAMLNLDSETTVRSDGGQRHTTELQRLPRKRLDLTINLPRGLEAGQYELAFSQDHSPPMLTLRGQAKIEEGLTVLRVQPDLSELPPGRYHLRIRREGSAWRESEVLLF